jgi:hypothetical protein
MFVTRRPRSAAGRTAVITTTPTARNGPSVKAAGITLPRNTTDTIGIARSGLSVNRIPPRRQRRARAASGVGTGAGGGGSGLRGAELAGGWARLTPRSWAAAASGAHWCGFPGRVASQRGQSQPAATAKAAHGPHLWLSYWFS